MYKEIEVPAKNEVEAINIARNKLELAPKYLVAELISNPKLEDKIYFVTVKDEIDLIIETKKYLENLMGLFGIGCTTELSTIKEHQEYSIKINTNDDVAQLIGKDGQTLQAITFYTQQFMSQFLEQPIKRCIIDINNYLAKKDKPIVLLATSMAKQVLRTKRDVALRPMHPHSRWIVHDTLTNWNKHIATESQGEGYDRHIVIKYVN
jgi:spoIIIJ-associated protein